MVDTGQRPVTQALLDRVRDQVRVGLHPLSVRRATEQLPDQQGEEDRGRLDARDQVAVEDANHLVLAQRRLGVVARCVQERRGQILMEMQRRSGMNSAIHAITRTARRTISSSRSGVSAGTPR